MPKTFRPSNRESTIISKIESSKDFARRKVITGIRECREPLANSIATKLIESRLVETANKNMVEEQIGQSLNKLCFADDFEVDYQISPFRKLISTPHVVSLYLTAFVVEQLINHREIIDIFGTDKDIYNTINNAVVKFLPE